MYDDASWYQYTPEATAQPIVRRPTISSQAQGHRRKESLLQQPNGVGGPALEPKTEPLENVYEDIENTNTPPEPTLTRRAASYSDFYHVVKAQLSKDGSSKRKKKPRAKDRNLEALMLGRDADTADKGQDTGLASWDAFDEQLLVASQQEYLLHRDQLNLAERHLDSLIGDANATLELLTSLSDSFQAVEAQTSTFQAQCEDLLSEQRRLEALAHDVGTDLHYYSYLETASRRLNAPGASKIVDHEHFGEMMESLESCVRFMESHKTYRDRDSFLARYNALLTKALHLLDHGFSSHLERVSSDVAKQIATTKSESARHALAYGRFEEMMFDSYSLLPNMHQVIRSAYDPYGRVLDTPHDASPYSNAATAIFQSYFATRDRDLKVMTQHGFEEYEKETKALSVETASRNYIKQSFERLYSEDGLFYKMFSVEPMWNTSPASVFGILKTINTNMAHPGNLTPLATKLQSVLQTAQLKTICSVVGWLASEYSIAESDDEESPFQKKCREYAARLLVEHLWPFTDRSFEADITKTISRAVAQDSALKIGPVVGGVSSSNAYPLVKRAVELLAMFDHAMPKERSSKNSPVVFKIVQETIQVLQRAEARIKSIKADTDPDLFMVKNLLIIKNELVSLEIGDIRSSATQNMQHFSQIWDTLSPQNWMSFFGSFIGSAGGYWTSSSSTAPRSVTAKTLTVEDMSEQLDELLRQSIYAFTRRWGVLMNESQARKAGVKPIAKVEGELDGLLQTAFSNQPEVVGKLREAIALNAQVQSDAKDGKQGVKRY